MKPIPVINITCSGCNGDIVAYDKGNHYDFVCECDK